MAYQVGDRVSILPLEQIAGGQTERTLGRVLEVLSHSGVPVYSVRHDLSPAWPTNTVVRYFDDELAPAAAPEGARQSNKGR